MTARLRFFIALSAVTLASAPARAQDRLLVDSATLQAPVNRAVADSLPHDVGPTLAHAAVAVRRDAPLVMKAPAPMADKQTFDRSSRYMILGGAALLTGIVVGGTPGRILEVGGAGVGLYGLYLYLQ